MAAFRSFEYMAWSKAVPPGSRFPLHVSGLSAPAISIDALLWQDCLAPERETQAALLDDLRRYLGISGCDGLIVSGASEAAFVALAAHVARGAPVIVEQPAYAAFARSAQFVGGVPVTLERRATEGWRLEPALLDRLLVASGARVVAITDPHNPTGISLDGDTRRALIEVVERRGAVLIVDEIFAPFRGAGRSPAWAATSNRVLSLGSLTKAWGLAPLRTGWVIGDAALLRPCKQVFDLLGVNPPSATMALARRALQQTGTLDARALRASCRVNEILTTAPWAGERLVPPHHGVIGFLRLPEGWDSEAAACVLRRLDDVQVVPGRFFGRDDHIRIGFDPETTDGARACRLVAARLEQPPASARHTPA